MKKSKSMLISSLVATLVVTGALTFIGVYFSNQNNTEVRFKIMETNTTNMMINNVRSNGGQSVLIKGKAKNSNVLIDAGSTYYSEALTLQEVTTEFNSRIDTLILTSLAEEYNGGLEKLFNTTRYPIPIVRNLYYPGYKVDNDVSRYLENTLIPKLKGQGCNVCTASDVASGSELCSDLINLSSNYELQILNTRQYTDGEIQATDMNKHNLILSVNNKKDSFYFLIDGGLTEDTLKLFNSYYSGINGKVKAWLLSNQNLSAYINSEYYFGFKPQTTIFTASSYSIPPTSIYNRMSIDEFKSLLTISGKNIYTPLSMGTITVNLATSGKMTFKGSKVTMYNAVNNTENKPFIYSDIVRRNTQLCNAVKEVLNIDVSYK